jgi:hypothetical protein
MLGINVVPLEAALLRIYFYFLLSVLTNTTVRVGFVADQVAKNRFFSQHFSFPCHHSISAAHSFIHHRSYVIFATDSVVEQRTRAHAKNMVLDALTCEMKRVSIFV